MVKIELEKAVRKSLFAQSWDEVEPPGPAGRKIGGLAVFLPRSNLLQMQTSQGPVGFPDL